MLTEAGTTKPEHRMRRWTQLHKVNWKGGESVKKRCRVGALPVPLRRRRQPLNRPEVGGTFHNADGQQVIKNAQAVMAAEGAEMLVLADGESEGLSRACVEGQVAREHPLP